MTKHNPITNIDVTIKEIYDEYTSNAIRLFWEARNDDSEIIDRITHNFRQDIYGLLNFSLRRQTLRRMFSDGDTTELIPTHKFNLIDEASTNLDDFTISIYDDNGKLISVLTTDEISW
jgi:hypothetical protein